MAGAGRPIAAYTMCVDGRAASTSLATTEIEPLGNARSGPAAGPNRALLRSTEHPEHTVYLNGIDGDTARRAGVADLLGVLAWYLGSG